MNRTRCLPLILCMMALSYGASPLKDGESSRSRAHEIDLKRLNERYRNAVVKIEFTAIMNFNETKLNPGKSERYAGSDAEGGHGTGFFINEDEILTNAHVVEKARRGSIYIKSPATGNVKFKVEVVGIGGSSTIDLAVLRLPSDEQMRLKKQSGLKSIPFLSLGNSDSLKQSDQLAIFGFPTNSDELKVIQAEVTGRQYQHYAGETFFYNYQFIEVGPGGVVQSGNSGGPALGNDGKVVGIPTLGDYLANQGWLIPVSIIRLFLDRIRHNQAGKIPLDIPELGIALSKNSAGNLVLAGAPEDVTLFELGVMVKEVDTLSIAEKWGITRGDIIIGFANKRKNISCALDFEGFMVITGLMARWPQNNTRCSNLNAPKLHLFEMIFTSTIGDTVTFWILRRPRADAPSSTSGLFTLTKTLGRNDEAEVPELGLYEKPDYEYWGDLVVQDFNRYNSTATGVPATEIVHSGVLVTYVEPNSIASQNGLRFSGNSIGISSSYRSKMMFGGRESWYIIEKVNGKAVADLSQYRSALRKAEDRFDSLKSSSAYKPERKILYPERYAEFTVRTKSRKHETISFTMTLPIDDAVECSGILQKSRDDN
jgi:S1-C subfamily serine protease